METAKANKLNIYDYLTHVFKKLSVAHSNEVIKTSFPYSSIHL
ncbi:transposase domain-containing protein [Teredinibacter turnerae]